MLHPSNAILLLRAISAVLIHTRDAERQLLRSEAARFLEVLTALRSTNALPKHVLRRYRIMSERIVAGIQDSHLKDSYVSLMAATQSLENDLTLLEQMKNQSGCEGDNFFIGG